MMLRIQWLYGVLMIAVVPLFLVVAQDSDYHRGRGMIQAGDVDGLRTLLEQVPPPILMPEPEDSGPDFYPEALVVVAVRTGRAELVELFLERGLSLGTQVTFGASSLFSLLVEEPGSALYRLAQRYLDDPGISNRHFDRVLQQRFGSNRTPEADEIRRWVEDWDVRFRAGIATGLLSVGRDQERLQIVRERTRGIQDFDVVPAFLAQDPRNSGEYIDVAPEIIASSFLADAQDPVRYHSDAAIDGDLSTSWVEGRDGAGVGDSIVYRIPTRSDAESFEISFFPGYGEERFFSRNNRLRTARIEWYEGDYFERPFMRFGSFRLLHSTEIVQIPDEFDWVTVPVPDALVHRGGRQPRGYVRIVIEDVYPGSDWDDTCIAEIRYHPASAGP